MVWYWVSQRTKRSGKERGRREEAEAGGRRQELGWRSPEPVFHRGQAEGESAASLGGESTHPEGFLF